jgi:hypothetical protein
MNNREVIKIIEDISDILLELNDQFDTSLIGEYSRSGMHDRFKEFDLELNYNNILDYFQSIPPNINRPTIKFEIKTKNSTNNFWIQPFYKIDGIISNRIIEERRHKVFQSTIEFMKKYNSIFNRIRSLLGGEYEIAYILPILKIGVGEVQQLRVGKRFAHLLDAAVDVTAMGDDVFYFFAEETGFKTQHTMGGWVLRTHVNDVFLFFSQVDIKQGLRHKLSVRG